jgi:hypothetical protein
VSELCKRFGYKNVKEFVQKLFGENGVDRRLIGIPTSIRVTLRYIAHTTHTHSSGSLQIWEFRGNSVFDPDYTNVGYQPVGFDEFAAFFQYYRVTGSRITVNTSSLTEDVPQAVGVRAIRELVLPTSYSPAIMGTLSSWDIVSTKGIPNIKIHNHATTKALYGGQVDTDQDFGAAVNTNPVKTWYWQIFSQSCNNASTSVVAITPVIEYDVIFSQKQVLGTS